MFDRLPPALAAATSLTSLDLRGRGDQPGLLALTAADVQATLCHMPRLRELKLDTESRSAGAAALDELRRTNPALQLLS